MPYLMFFPTGVFLEINQGMYNHQTNYSYFFPQGFSKELKETCWSQDGLNQRGECYNTLFDLIKTTVTIEAMKLMVKAMVIAIVKAAVTAMFIELLEEELKN